MMTSLDNNANTWIKDKIWAHVLKWVDMKVLMTSYISVADPGEGPRGASFPYLRVWKTVHPSPPHVIWTSGSAAVFGQKPGNSRLWKEESRLNSTLFRVTKQNPHQTAERLDQ